MSFDVSLRHLNFGLCNLLLYFMGITCTFFVTCFGPQNLWSHLGPFKTSFSHFSFFLFSFLLPAVAALHRVGGGALMIHTHRNAPRVIVDPLGAACAHYVPWILCTPIQPHIKAPVCFSSQASLGWVYGASRHKTLRKNAGCIVGGMVSFNN